MHGTQLHHELGLKTKRYESRGRQAPARNPITPLTGAGGVDPCASVRSSAAALTAGADFSALNSPPMMLNRSVGNPILGYSVHPLPQAARAELLDGVGPPHSDPRASAPHESGGTSGSSARARIEELHRAIAEERSKRQELEESYGR